MLKGEKLDFREREE